MQYFTCDILPTRTPCWSPWQLCYYFITIKQIRQAAYWTCHYYNDKCASSNDLFCSDGSVTRLLFVCPDLSASWVLYIGLWCCWKGPCAQRNNRATKKWMTVAAVASPVQMEIDDVQISQGTQAKAEVCMWHMTIYRHSAHRAVHFHLICRPMPWHISQVQITACLHRNLSVSVPNKTNKRVENFHVNLKFCVTCLHLFSDQGKRRKSSD